MTQKRYQYWGPEGKVWSQCIAPDTFDSRPVGGAIPENLYIVGPFYDGLYLNLQKHLRTYEGLIAAGATEPDDKELLRLIVK